MVIYCVEHPNLASTILWLLQNLGYTTSKVYKAKEGVFQRKQFLNWLTLNILNSFGNDSWHDDMTWFMSQSCLFSSNQGGGMRGQQIFFLLKHSVFGRKTNKIRNNKNTPQTDLCPNKKSYILLYLFKFIWMYKYDIDEGG